MKQILPCWYMFLTASLVFQGVRAEAPQDLASLRSKFEAQSKKNQEPITSLNSKYLAALHRLGEQESKSGNLDGTLKVRNEIEVFKEEKVFNEKKFEDRISEHRGLRNLQETYLRSRTLIQPNVERAQVASVKAYLAMLEAVQEDFTKQQRIAEAVLVKKEREVMAQRLATLTNADDSQGPIYEVRAHLVGKGEVELFQNGKRIRYRNDWREANPDTNEANDYTDAVSSSLELAIGDVIALKLRGDATFRGCVLGFVTEDKEKHFRLTASSFQLLDSGERVDPRTATAAVLANEPTESVRRSGSDSEMERLWREHRIAGCEFVQSPQKGLWALFAAVITEDMIVDRTRTE